MATLVSLKTRLPEEVPDSQVDALLASGSHSLMKGEQVPLKAPDGSYATIPAENVQYAIQNGYKVFTPTQSAIDQAVEDNKGAAGSLKVLGSQVIDQLGLGIPELIYEKTGDPLKVAQYEAIKKDHFAANALGNVAGVVGSLATGAPLFKGAAKLGEITAGQVAARLGATGLGEEVGKRALASTAKEIVANLAAKTAGGAIEGAALFAPHAVTEVALGDPNLAGETVLEGLGIGALFGAGGYAAKGLLNLGSKSLRSASELVGEAPLTAQKAARTAAETATGVKGEELERFIQNPERVNAAPEFPQLKDQVDMHVTGLADELEKAKFAADSAQKDLEEAYAFEKNTLGKKLAPESIRNELLTKMEEQKAVLGDLSEKADAILGSSGMQFKKDELTGLLDKVKESIGTIGSEDVAAGARIDALKDRVMKSLPDVIESQDMRDIMRQVRKDINFNRAAGEFNDTSNKALTKFTETISGILKKDNPEYASIMREMAERSENLGEMSKHFGTPEKADSMLTKIFEPKSRIQSQALEKFQTITGENFLGKLEELKNTKDLLEEARVRKIPEKIVPGHFDQANKALKQYNELLERQGDIVKRLNRDRTQSIIKRQGYKNASIEDRRALEKLGTLVNDNVVEKILDRNTLEAFDKTSTNGSRKALVFGALGAAIGGPVGAAIGSAAGAGLDIYSGKLLKKLIESAPDTAGLLFVEQQMKKAADKLDEIPSILQKMVRKTPATATGVGTNIIHEVLMRKEKDEYKKKTSKHESMEKLRKEVSVLVSNPSLMLNQINQYAGQISNRGAPNIGNATAMKMSNAATYIYNAIPKPPAPTSPFAPKQTFKPSDQQISAFMQKLQIVEKPLSILEDLQKGTLTHNHIEAMKAVYPGLLGEIQKRVQEYAMSGEAKAMPYQSRMKLSLLMESPMDKSLDQTALQTYQMSYHLPDQSVDKNQGKPVQLSEGYMSASQRLEAKTS